MPGSQRIRRRAGVRQARTIGPEWGSATQGNSVRTEFDDEGTVGSSWATSDVPWNL
jgi:hypothetical protein